MDQETLLRELCDASALLGRHAGWVQKTYNLPKGVVDPFGRAIMGLGRCDFKSNGLYVPNPTGRKAFIIAEATSTILPSKIGIDEIVDLVAVPFEAPDRWFLRLGRANILGLENLSVPHDRFDPIILHGTPLRWLQGGANGLCVLNHRKTNVWALIRAGPIVPESAALQQHLFSKSSVAYAANRQTRPYGGFYAR